MSARFALLLVLASTSTLLVCPPRAACADDRGSRDATTGRLALELGGVRYGFATVRANESAERGAAALPLLLVNLQDVATPLVTLVGTFLGGRPVKSDLRLSSGAVIRKVHDARLTSIRLPALGSGGAADVELGFAAAAMTTQPLLSAKEAPPPHGARITTFLVEISGMRAIEAAKLDAITLTQRPDGTVVTGEIAFEATAGGAPPFVAWQKANAGRAAPRTVRLDYVGSDARSILRLELDRCTPSAVKPLGASGTTRVILACAAIKAS